RPSKSFLVTDNARTTPRDLRFSSQGPGWVRVAPLILIGKTAPYLHNGSVPSLEQLLIPAEARPRSFSVGYPQQQFNFDATLPGNRNSGHLFGINLTSEEKSALIAFLNSLP